MRRVALVVTIALAGTTGAATGLAGQSPMEAVRAYRAENEARILQDYRALLRMPNVASDSVGIRRNAAYIRDRLAELGLEAELLTVEGAPPVVLGELRVPGARRTLALYAHYDGQPADTSRWTHAPWEPALYTASMAAGGDQRPFPEPGAAVDPDWRIYGRSAADDKAPIGALLHVLEAFRRADLTPSSNLILFFEGEEEAGSPHLDEYLNRYRDRLEADAWLFLDGPIHASGRPQLTFGVRGVTGLSVTVYGPIRSLHSGHYGNWAPVPGMMLARLLATMKDGTGRVLIDGFYDTVAPLGPEEQAALDALPDTDADLMQELGLARTEGAPESLAERLLLPSLTVKGLASGNVGPLTRNVIPAEATAELGIRLVKGNDPDHMKDLVEAHIRDQGYHIVREAPDRATRLAHPRIARVTRNGGYPAARTDMSLPVVRSVVDAARTVAGDDLILLPSLGGSLPLYLFTDGLDKPAVIVPIANADNSQHAPDENLRVGALWYGMDLFAALLAMD